MITIESNGAELLTVGEVAELAGAATSAIRFYERRGLIESQRTSGNQRRYQPWVPCVVRVARVAQRVGLSVQEIAEVLEDIPDEPRPEDWQRVTDYLVADAERRIAELREVLVDLKSETKRCDLPGR
ncbi:MerR family DNA-binding transcriptional regulator [Corynebacterium glyciniphilum]|uniref:MerR family DNA-binding transcriptional regulator n=1 Tax=Corynebacterium glyciniphilum TaxID=1404244 RepID=UPI0011AB4857|nr:MerR family DNA-binding transcriptional regulator [Corynebacterium glyciniphilum]